jgi:carboxymethylenebutenolidase
MTSPVESSLIEGPDGIDVYRAAPSAAAGAGAGAAGAGVRGGIVLIHEIWGLAPHIREVADRLAAQGYLTHAPDVLSRFGVTPEVGADLERLMSEPDETKRLAAQPVFRERLAPTRDPGYAAWTVTALRGVVTRLEAEPGVEGRVAAVGFCFGGTYTFALAAADARIRAAVPFYGSAPDDATSARASILAFYGERDSRITDGLAALRAAMTRAGANFTAQVYPGVGHAFFNDTRPGAYHADTAADAWRRTLEFLATTLA